MLTTSSVQLHSNCRFFQSLLDSVIRTWDLRATGEAHLHNSTDLVGLDFMYVVLIRGSFRGFYHLSRKSYEEKNIKMNGYCQKFLWLCIVKRMCAVFPTT